MDISNLDVKLEDIMTVCRLISTKNHLMIGNLTVDHVKRLDQTVRILGLDYNAEKYYERSRFKGEAPVVLRATLYGKTKYDDEKEEDMTHLVYYVRSAITFTQTTEKVRNLLEIKLPEGTKRLKSLSVIYIGGEVRSQRLILNTKRFG